MFYLVCGRHHLAAYIFPVAASRLLKHEKLKILCLSATVEQKSFKIYSPLSSLWEATSCGRYFSDYYSESAKI
jgi:hypothetical protein